MSFITCAAAVVKIGPAQDRLDLLRGVFEPFLAGGVELDPRQADRQVEPLATGVHQTGEQPGGANLDGLTGVLSTIWSLTGEPRHILLLTTRKAYRWGKKTPPVLDQ